MITMRITASKTATATEKRWIKYFIRFIFNDICGVLEKTTTRVQFLIKEACNFSQNTIEVFAESCLLSSVVPLTPSKTCEVSQGT